VKKKSPPYAIIGAVLLGIIAVVAVVKWKSAQDAAAAAALAAEDAKRDQEMADLKAKLQVVVTPTATDMRNVYYATQPVEAGAKITPVFFEKKLTPNEILPDAFTDKSEIVDYYAIRNIEKGDPLTTRNIGKTLPYMEQRISPGMRALALPIFNAEANNTSGFAVDGDKVDLLYTQTSKDGSVLYSTQLVMQNLSVLYVPGPKIESEQVEGVVPAPAPGGSISIMFEVTPEQAQALVHLSQTKTGKFSMILRSRRDKSEIKIKPFVADDYSGNYQKIQRTTDKSTARVQELAAKIEAEEKTQGSQGNTNETPTPTPPSP
jgi:Flp pilus assembly protein CpaB